MANFGEIFERFWRNFDFVDPATLNRKRKREDRDREQQEWDRPLRHHGSPLLPALARSGSPPPSPSQVHRVPSPPATSFESPSPTSSKKGKKKVSEDLELLGWLNARSPLVTQPAAATTTTAAAADDDDPELDSLLSHSPPPPPRRKSRLQDRAQASPPLPSRISFDSIDPCPWTCFYLWNVLYTILSSLLFFPGLS